MHEKTEPVNVLTIAAENGLKLKVNLFDMFNYYLQSS